MTQLVALLLSAFMVQTAAPKPGPWISLFDGKSMAAWRIFKTETAPKMCETPGAPGNKDCWEIVNGILRKDGHANDIASKATFGDFEFELEWNIGEASNSGVFYRGTDEFNQIYWSAPEYQLLDDSLASDNKTRLTCAGAAYGLYPSPAGHLKPVGEWNSTRIVARGNHVEHWLNGFKLLEYELNSPEWLGLVAKSKFNAWPNYGRNTKGHIALQGDHTGTLAFRNIRIREF